MSNKYFLSVLLGLIIPDHATEALVSRFEFARIDLAVTSLLANQPVASESEHAHDQCQRAAVTPPCLASPDVELTLLL